MHQGMHHDLKSLDAADLAVDTSVDAVPTASLILIARPVLVVDLLLAFQLVADYNRYKFVVLYSAFQLVVGHRKKNSSALYSAFVSLMVVMELPDKTVAAASESSFPVASVALRTLDS